MNLGFLKGISTGNLGVGKAASGGGGADPIGDALRANAIAYWKMDEASGTRADATGNGNDLNEISLVSSASGKVGNALSLSNSASEAQRSNDTALAFGDQNFAFAFWTRFNALPSLSIQTIFIHVADAGAPPPFGYYFGLEDFDPGAHFIFYTYAGDAFSTEITADVDTWYFIVAEYDTTNDVLRIYVNNALAVETPTIRAMSARGNRFTVGQAESEGKQSVDGLVDEMLVLNRLTTADERVYLYNSGNGRTLYP